MGYCIGGCFAGKLLQRAPDRVLAAVFCQTVGHRPENPTVMYRHSKDNWEPDFLKRRPDVSPDTIEQYFHNLYAVQPDFLYSVSRDFIRNCRTPMLVLPDDVPGHPLQTSIDVASLAPNAEITVYPWKEPEELRRRTLAAELGASNVAAHRGQAAMPCVTHDLFVGDTIAVSRRDEPGAQAMGAERFSQRAFQSSLGGTFEKDLAHCVSGQPGASFAAKVRPRGHRTAPPRW